MAGVTRTRPKRLRDLMRPASRLRYLAWRASGTRGCLTIELRSGERLVMRPPPAGDLSVAYEVFVEELYHPPRAIFSVRRIIDVGANVGYALTHLAARFQDAELIAFEPHPSHLVQLQQNIKANGLAARTTVVPAAVGVAPGRAFLSDAGEASRVFTDSASGRIEVAVTDFFDAVGPEPIGILKMDCEGSEYALVMDPRFAALAVDTLALEWHNTREHPDADAGLRARLARLGFAIQDGADHESPDGRFGMLWGYGPNTARKPSEASA